MANRKGRAPSIETTFVKLEKLDDEIAKLTSKLENKKTQRDAKQAILEKLITPETKEKIASLVSKKRRGLDKLGKMIKAIPDVEEAEKAEETDPEFTEEPVAETTDRASKRKEARKTAKK